jgi:hypothetical protein
MQRRLAAAALIPKHRPRRLRVRVERFLTRESLALPAELVPLVGQAAALLFA